MPHADVCFWHKADIARRTGGRPLSTKADILNGGTLSRQCNSLGLDASRGRSVFQRKACRDCSPHLAMHKIQLSTLIALTEQSWRSL